MKGASVADEPLPLFEPKDALAFFVRKGLQIGFSWLDVQREEHDKAFTVAKAMTRDLLEDIRDAMETALREGETLAMFAQKLKPKLIERGWWGRKTMIDPLTAERVDAQLGSDRRLATIYRTNMRTSYASGRWARIQRNKDAFPLLRYVSVMDGREREEHRAWHNTILPVDHSWWETHYPPCDWGCRCRAIPLNARMAARKRLDVTETTRHFGTRQWTNKRTGEVRTIEKGIGAGWDYHPGRSAVDGLVPEPLPPGFDGDEAATSMPRSVFHQAFGLTEANGFSAVWIDKGGWPVAISQRMKDGEGATRVAMLVAAMTDPDEIRWAWVRDESDRAVLMRRYVKRGTMVDVGRLGWRIGKARTGGSIVWRRGDAVAAAYNPHQPRDRNGRWARASTVAYVDAAWEAHGLRQHYLPALNKAGVEKFAKVGFDVDRKFVALDSGYVRHIRKNHGAEKRLGHVSVTKEDVRAVRSLLQDSAWVKRGSPAISTRGIPRIESRTRRGSVDYHITTEVTRNHLVLVSMHKRVVN